MVVLSSCLAALLAPQGTPQFEPPQYKADVTEELKEHKSTRVLCRTEMSILYTHHRVLRCPSLTWPFDISSQILALYAPRFDS